MHIINCNKLQAYFNFNFDSTHFDSTFELSIDFAGTSCEVDVDECFSNLCGNNGTCEDQVNGFNCHCMPGFTGILSTCINTRHDSSQSVQLTL